MRRPHYLLTFFFITGFCIAQEAPIEWGIVEPEDQKIQRCDFDPGASAYILDDYGRIIVNQSQASIYFTFRHHRRVMILNQAGTEHADVRILLHTGGNLEQLSDLRAQTIDTHGMATEVNSESIFREKIDDNWTSVQFSFPNVREGAILEFVYVIRSENITQLRKWFFQHSLPVRNSILHLVVPQTMGYVWLTNGKHVIQTENSEVRDQSGGVLTTTTKNLVTFRVNGATGLRNDLYTTDLDHYKYHIQFQLADVYHSTGLKQEFMTSWTEIAKVVESNERMGGQYLKKKNHKELLTLLPQIIDGARSDREKVKSIHQYIANHVRWNDWLGIVSDRDLDQALEDGTANGAALNYMFICLARAAGLNAKPVLISTRSHGEPYEEYPLIYQFNHVIAAVDIDGSRQLIDVHSPRASYQLLREGSLNFRGWVADVDSSHWIDIPSPMAARSCRVTLTLGAGKVDGTVQSRYSGYCGFLRRSKEPEMTIEHLQNVEALLDGITIGEEQVDRFDDVDQAVVVSIPVTAEIDRNNLLYINPLAMSDYKINQLRETERSYPIDFRFPVRETLSTTVTYDTAFYTLESVPEPFAFKLPRNEGSCSLFVNHQEGKVDFTFKLELSLQRYMPYSYEALREFMSGIEQNLGQVVVLRFIND